MSWRPLGNLRLNCTLNVRNLLAFSFAIGRASFERIRRRLHTKFLEQLAHLLPLLRRVHLRLVRMLRPKQSVAMPNETVSIVHSDSA
jgi:hypothetical protein